MTDDLVKRLRTSADPNIVNEAAAEIERLRVDVYGKLLALQKSHEELNKARAENTRLREALRVVAKHDVQSVALDALHPNTDRKR